MTTTTLPARPVLTTRRIPRPFAAPPVWPLARPLPNASALTLAPIPTPAAASADTIARTVTLAPRPRVQVQRLVPPSLFADRASAPRIDVDALSLYPTLTSLSQRQFRRRFGQPGDIVYRATPAGLQPLGESERVLLVTGALYVLGSLTIGS